MQFHSSPFTVIVALVVFYATNAIAMVSKTVEPNSPRLSRRWGSFSSGEDSFASRQASSLSSLSSSSFGSSHGHQSDSLHSKHRQILEQTVNEQWQDHGKYLQKYHGVHTKEKYHKQLKKELKMLQAYNAYPPHEKMHNTVALYNKHNEYAKDGRNFDQHEGRRMLEDPEARKFERAIRKSDKREARAQGKPKPVKPSPPEYNFKPWDGIESIETKKFVVTKGVNDFLQRAHPGRRDAAVRQLMETDLGKRKQYTKYMKKYKGKPLPDEPPQWN